MPATRSSDSGTEKEPPEVLAMIIRPLLCCHPNPWWIILVSYTEKRLDLLKKIDPQLYRVALEAHTFITNIDLRVLRQLAEFQLKLRVEALRVQLEATQQRMLEFSAERSTGSGTDGELPEVMAKIIKPLLCCWPTPWWIYLVRYTEVELSDLKESAPQLYKVALRAHAFISKQDRGMLRQLAEFQFKLRVEALRVQLKMAPKRLTTPSTKEST